MRDYDNGDTRLYAPVLQRMITLAAVVIAIPMMMWTITMFVRSAPTFQHLTLAERPPLISPAEVPPVPPTAQPAAPASLLADAGTPTNDARAPLPDPNERPLKGPFHGLSSQAPALPQVTTAPPPPVQATPIASSPPGPAETVRAVPAPVAPAKAPTFQHLTLTEQPPSISPAAVGPPVPPTAQPAAAPAPLLADVGTPTSDARAPLPDPNKRPLKGPLLGLPALPQVSTPPVQATSIASSPGPARTAPAAPAPIAPAKAPTSQHLTLSEQPPPISPAAVGPPPVPLTAQPAAPASLLADAGTPTSDARAPPPDPNKRPLTRPLLGLPTADGSPAPVLPQVSTARPPPVQPTPIASSPPGPAETAPAAAAGSEAAPAWPGTASRLATNSPGPVAAAPSNRGLAWPNPNTNSAPRFGAPPQQPADSETASAEVLPTVEPIKGAIPLPRHRPSTLDMTATATSPGPVAAAPSNRGLAWPNPNTNSAPRFGAPPQQPADSETASAEVLPTVEPIKGAIPLPRHRPSTLDMTATATIGPTGPVPRPRARPSHPPQLTSSTSPPNFLRIFRAFQ